MTTTQLLPEHARAQLRRAAQTPKQFEGDTARLQAIERLVDKFRLLYPWCFKREDEDADRRE